MVQCTSSNSSLVGLRSWTRRLLGHPSGGAQRGIAPPRHQHRASQPNPRQDHLQCKERARSLWSCRRSCGRRMRKAVPQTLENLRRGTRRNRIGRSGTACSTGPGPERKLRAGDVSSHIRAASSSRRSGEGPAGVYGTHDQCCRVVHGVPGRGLHGRSSIYGRDDGRWEHGASGGVQHPGGSGGRQADHASGLQGDDGPVGSHPHSVGIPRHCTAHRVAAEPVTCGHAGPDAFLPQVVRGNVGV
mmetsp:Transcript_7601/g.46856  ORF Transcript_7601/g.46856 Transcript_7601/m.46856 type:complete len:244 (-) Transcript_7601:444-1175(-)